MLTLKDVRTMVTGNYEGRVLTMKLIQKEEILMKELIDKSISGGCTLFHFPITGTRQLFI